MRARWPALLIAAALVAATAGAIAALTSGDRPASSPSSDSDTRPLYYRDPMHPSYTSPTPGKAPDCGMDLAPVYATSTGSAGSAPSPAVRVERVEISRASRTVRTIGRVVLDEDRVYPVSTHGDGWVTAVHPGATTGSTVRKGQPLATVYGRDYTNAQRAYLFALRASENPPPVRPGDDAGQAGLTLQEARLVLENIGFGREQIERLTASRQVTVDVVLTAPADGVVVARNAVPKQRFDRDVELFRIADLRRMWVLADIDPADAPLVRHGARAVLLPPGGAPATLPASVDAALPQADGGTRSLRVRLLAANPDHRLRPEMIVDVALEVGEEEAITVPVEAVRDAGGAKTVLIDLGEGRYEPRAVETGWRNGGRVQIVRGLRAGESVVVSGGFLLDAEAPENRPPN